MSDITIHHNPSCGTSRNNRPIVVTPLGTKLCRPSEAVLEILPAGPLPAFGKADGERIIDAGMRRG